MSLFLDLPFIKTAIYMSQQNGMKGCFSPEIGKEKAVPGVLRELYAAMLRHLIRPEVIDNADFPNNGDPEFYVVYHLTEEGKDHLKKLPDE